MLERLKCGSSFASIVRHFSSFHFQMTFKKMTQTFKKDKQPTSRSHWTNRLICNIDCLLACTEMTKTKKVGILQAVHVVELS